MIKRILIFLLITSFIFIITFFSHQFLLQKNDFTSALPIVGMYLYHSIAGALVYTLIELVFSKLPNQAGFAFLASVFLKIGFFILIFSTHIFKDTPLEMFERLSIVIPFFTFLLLESFFSFRLLNKA